MQLNLQSHVFDEEQDLLFKPNESEAEHTIF